MTEQEYVDATNLAKVRASKRILHDTLPNDGQHEELWRNAMASLSVWERELTNAVKVRGEVQKPVTSPSDRCAVERFNGKGGNRNG